MDELQETHKYIKITFVIFQTGSCIIVGNCSEKVLRFVFDFVKKMLQTEYQQIVIHGEAEVIKLADPETETETEPICEEVAQKKNRKRRITVTTSYFSELKNISI
jgi:hypothetical protein